MKGPFMIRRRSSRLTAVLVCAAACAPAPAFAHQSHASDGYRDAPHAGYDGPARDAWLADCRQKIAHRDNGIGGALIGGAVGGLAGNRLAGKSNRTVGTVAGAAVGAVAGMAIDKAEDRRDRDECEAYLDSYYASYAGGGYGYAAYGYGGYGPAGGYQAYGYPTYAHGYNQGCCGAPMMAVPVQQSEPECTETETVEYIDEPAPARRVISRPAPVQRTPARDKRVKVVPDKRIRIK